MYDFCLVILFLHASINGRFILFILASGQIALQLEETEGKIEQILQSLSQPLRYDLRTKFDKPLFKRSVTSLADIKVGQELRGLKLHFSKLYQIFNQLRY